jgi:DNA-binding winged helix-turn-helix (wHTH) protein
VLPLHLQTSSHCLPERRLVRDAVEIPLPHKVFTTLHLLVENAGWLLTRERLLEQVWPDVAVEEGNLNHNISILRKALGEQASGETYIETVPRVGYRFVAPVTKIADATGTQNKSESAAQVAPGDPILRHERQR